MALHDPDLIKAHESNQRAIALASISEAALSSFRAMTPAQRRFEHETATMQAIRNDILAKRPNHPDAPYYSRIASEHRKTAAALKALGL